MASTESPVFTASQDNNDNGGSQVSSSCLGIPLVLRIIMEHLCTKDLLALTLVNKLWNYEARSVLKNRGSLVATLRSYSPCQEVAEFASDLRQMNVVPFSGICIRLSAWEDCKECKALPTGALKTESLDPNYNIILDRVQWKCLRFKWGKKWDTGQKCQAFLLAQEILQNFSGDLEELKVHLEVRSEDFMRQVLRKCKFPRLKLLDLGATYDDGEDFTASTKALLSRAPKLEEFHEENWVDLEENVVEGSAAVLISHSIVQPAYDELSEGALAALRVFNLDLEVEEDDFIVERFNWVIPRLLESSKTTLKDVSLDAVFALPLMCYGVRLESVTHMTLRIDYCHLELTHPQVLTLLKAFDFTRMLPNLSKVYIRPVSNQMASEQTDEFIWQANVLLPDVPIPDRSVNITELSLFETVEYSAIPFLAQMFPNTKSLWIQGKQEREFPYGLIWEHFKTLEKLSLQKHGDYYRKMWPKNFDSVFCGIFPEEVAELMEKDEEYLRNVNIVPVMPAITCLSGLKNMDIRIYNYTYGNPGVSDEPLASGAPPTREYGSTFLFSKVTGLIAFARMPRLSIYILIDGDIPDRKQALGHLKRYATIWV